MAGLWDAPSVNFFSTTLNGGINNSVDTITLSSVTGLNAPGVLIINREDGNGTATPSAREVISFTGISGSDLTGVTRGYDGSTARAHSSGALVEAVFTVGMWNDAVAALTNVVDASTGAVDTTKVLTLTGTQTTTNKTLTAPVLTSPVLNTGLSGTAFLDEDTMSSDSATKVASQQSIKAYVDSKTPVDGWTASSDTWTYASASSFTIAGVDRTTTFTKGTRLKFTNSTLKYAVVASSSFSTDTTVNIIVNTDYVLANATISSPYYSYQISPQGYPTWFNITPTTSNFSGFSSIAGYIYKYRVEGASCTVVLHVQGTSNSASFSFTAPITGVSLLTSSDFAVAVVDNGTWQAGAGILGVQSATATFTVGKTIATIASGAYAGFTGSGTKGVNGQFTYQF